MVISKEMYDLQNSVSLEFFHAIIDKHVQLETYLSLIVVVFLLVSNPLYASSEHAIFDITYGDLHPLQKMDFYPGSSERSIMYLHGKGWVAGDKSDLYQGIKPLINGEFNVFSVNFRVGHRTAPKAIEDVLCAYQHIESFSESVGLSPRHISIMGRSAGGHLALTAGLIISDNKNHICKSSYPPYAVINLFGITDLLGLHQYDTNSPLANPKHDFPRKWIGDTARVLVISQKFSPINLIHSKAPKILSFHGTKDSVVPFKQAQKFHNLLNTPNELWPMQDKKHGNFGPNGWAMIVSKIKTFLRS